MDRIDLHVEVDSVNYEDLTTEKLEEPSENVKERVNKAREVQLARFKGEKFYSNSKMSEKHFVKHCKLDPESSKLIEMAFKRLNISARGYNRILKVARTIADLEGSENIKKEHVLEAIQYRMLDKKYTV